ncbi:MBL fold metallo-hydrolase [Hydrogenophaga sp. OTU3427]|uniref:MBL fold metallo-hydrolase n=1 Tax=Hydrogenophaga sp. OTU3427 TaxID=3043856 RepID=UPI00313B4F75
MSRWLGHLVGALAALVLAACATPAPSCDTQAPVPWRAVAPGVWVWEPAAPADISTANQGHVATTSVFIDGGEALVVDPGPSLRHGQRVRASLTCRFGARVRWVVNTHAHAENVLGNAAFADLQHRGQLDIVATPGTQAGMRQRCDQCLAHITEAAGAQALAGTTVVWPHRALAHGERLTVGRQQLQVLRVAQAHTEDDLLLWWPAQRVLWAGGLVYGDRLPELAQGSLSGWLRALTVIDALRPQVVIGGTASSAEGGRVPTLESTRRYLRALRDAVWAAMDSGRHASEAATLALPDFAHWAGYAQRQGFNVLRAWRELEPLWMNKGEAPDR